MYFIKCIFHIHQNNYTQLDADIAAVNAPAGFPVSLCHARLANEQE